MINLKIDPEFQSQIPPLTDDEFKQDRKSTRLKILSGQFKVRDADMHRRGGRNCVNLTQFLRGGFLGSSRVLVVAVSTGLYPVQSPVS